MYSIHLIVLEASGILFHEIEQRHIDTACAGKKKESEGVS